MTKEEFGNILAMGNDVAMQWYALIKQKTIPINSGTVTVANPPGPGMSATFGSGALLLGGMALLALVLILSDD